MGEDYEQGITHVGDLLAAHDTAWDSEKLAHMFNSDDARDIK